MDLHGTRESLMSVGPITYREIAAYQATSLGALTAWDVRLIRRLDTAVRAILNAKASDKPASLGDFLRSKSRS